MTRRRSCLFLGITILVLVTVSAQAQPVFVPIDFNGDKRNDLAIGSPFQSLPGKTAAGAVTILYRLPSGAFKTAGNQLITAQFLGRQARAFDYFGWSLSYADFNKDGFTDLIVGAPGRNQRAGSVFVVFGSPRGLTRARAIEIKLPTTSASGVRASAGEGDLFGNFVLGVDDTFIAGAPGADAKNKTDSGTVIFFEYAAEIFATRQTLTSRTSVTNGRFGTNGTVGFFNNDDSADLAITEATPNNSGKVHFFNYSNLTLLFNTPPSKTLNGPAGSFFGGSLESDACRLFIGAPLFGSTDQGRVSTFTFPNGPLTTIYTGQPGDLAGTSVAPLLLPTGEPGAAIGSPGAFGGSGRVILRRNTGGTRWGDYAALSNPQNRGTGWSGTYDEQSNQLAFGAPFTTVAGKNEAGKLEVFDLDTSKFTQVNQNSPGVPGTAAPRVRFAFGVVKSGRFKLLIGRDCP